FIHIEVLRHSGFADLGIGEAVCVRVINGPRGLMAAQILPWDTAESAEDDLPVRRRTDASVSR
ncbi:MAG: hypothetical protein P3W94_002435, partial [Paracoccus sp. (in: a-proteobacteria)]|nr:hypothetical protein [Paracoccus sp. (in: a-proteobacteria)]